MSTFLLKNVKHLKPQFWEKCTFPETEHFQIQYMISWYGFLVRVVSCENLGWLIMGIIIPRLCGEHLAITS